MAIGLYMMILTKKDIYGCTESQIRLTEKKSQQSRHARQHFAQQLQPAGFVLLDGAYAGFQEQ